MDKATEEMEKSSKDFSNKEASKGNDSDTRRKSPKKDEKVTASQKFIKLKRDLNTMETNIQAAAEARGVQRRTEMDKSRKIRIELLADHNLSSTDKIEEICKGWHSTKEKVIPQEVQAALIHQQQLFDDLIKDKKKLMDLIQQDLKARDDSFVTDLKKQTEELKLMLERMEEQDKTLTKAYREELQQWKENVLKAEETKRTDEKTVWEKCMKNLLDTELDKLLKRQQAVEEYNAKIHHLMVEVSEKFNIIRNKEVADFQTLELEIHQVESEKIFIEQKIEKLKADNAKLKAEYTQMKAKVSSTKSELTKLRVNKQTDKVKEKQLMEKQLKELNRKAQDYERLHKKRLHFAVADAIKFENMWLTEEAEVKELLERALYVDSMIYKQVLRIPWEHPKLSFAKSQRRWEERCAASQTLHCSEDQADATQTEANNGAAAEESVYNDESKVGSVAEERSRMATPRTVKRLMEILCDEASFLFEVKIVKLLDTLDENERIPIKIGYLFNTLGIKENDVPKLVDFLYKYGQQCPMESEDTATEPSSSTDEVEASSVSPVTSDPIDPTDVLEALKCFLCRQKQGRVKWSLQSVEAWDMSKDQAYWESLGNAITVDKLKIWEMTERKLKHHHSVLSEISKLSQEIQSLQQENTELQMVHILLQDQPLSFSPDATRLDME